MPNFGNMLGDIKSKLGFAGNNQGVQPDAYGEYDEYVDEYEDYGPVDDYDDYSTRGFGSRNRVTTRDAGASSMPRLVSYDDARESGRFTGGGSRRSGSHGRTMVDSSLPFSMTPEGAAQVSAAASRKRGEGLDSLFSPTDLGNGAASDAGLPVIGAASRSSSLDLHGASSIAGARRVTVVRPTSYEEAEGVTRALKAGDAVVLAMAATPADLFKRVLDFSFGAASALDASVDAVGNKVFAITRGSALSDAERASLSAQGVL